MIRAKRVYLLSSIVFLITAIFSIGFLHPDEQYYTLDFAFFKLGILDHLQTWELDTKIRPWTLPYLYVLLLAPLKFAGIENPFTLALIARVLSSAISLFTLVKFVSVFKEKLSHDQGKLFTLFTLFFWPIVFMSARTSSDNISTCFLILGISITLKELTKKNLLLGGLLLGIAFSLRHQTGILSLAFGLWILFAKKMCPITWIKFFASTILIGVLSGIALDSLGYGSFTLTPLNYLNENLIKDKISSFGVSPWWGYFSLILKNLNIFGLILIASTLVYIRKFPKSLESVLVLTFFIFHSMIGHKELRFIYPLLWISTFMLFKLIDFPKYKKSFNILFSLSLIGTLIISFKPAYTPLKFYKFLYHYQKEERLNLYTFKDRKGNYPELEMQVYKRSNLELLKSEIGPSSNFYTFTTKFSDLEVVNSKYNCIQEYISYPKWILEFNLFNWRDRSNIWALSKCSQ